MNNKLEIFKNEVKCYGDLYTKYIDSMNLWKDDTKYLEKLRDKYRVCPTYSLEKEIKEWESKEKDNFVLFSKYQCEMLKNGFDGNYAEKVEFIKLSDFFDKLNEEIKLIEKKSKKFGSKNEIGTNRVETMNAEGRKKYIHEYLLDDYNSLINQKKKILPKYKELYKKYIDSSYVELEKSESLNEIDVISSADEGLKLEEKYFNDMTIDERINYYKERINNILKAKNTGKKVYITVYGEKYYVPKKYEYLLRDYLKEIKKLNECKNESISESISANIINKDKDENYDEIKSFIDEKSDKKFVMKGVNKSYTLDDFEPLKVEFTDVSSTPDDRDIWSDSSLIPGNKKAKTVEVVKPTNIIDESSVITNNDYKNNKKIVVKSVKKSKNKLGLKKKIIAAAAIIGLALTTAISGFALFGKKNNDVVKDKSNSIISQDLFLKYPIDNLRDKVIEDNKDNVSDIQKKDYIIEQEIVSNNNNNNNNNKSVFRIGDTVNVKNNSYIYDNVYDAMNNTNGLNPYFDSSMNRNITGLFIKFNDEYVYTENQNNVDEYISNGGVIKSVVVGNYEGAYNFNDVKLKVKVK